MAEDSSRLHYDPKGYILLRNGVSFPNLTGTPSSKQRKKKKKKLEKKEADEKSKKKIEEVKKQALKKEEKDGKKDKDKPKSKDDEEGGEDEKDDPHSKLKKSDASVGEVMKNKVTLPITCTSAYFDMYDIVDDDVVRGKRFVDCRKRRGADASPCSDVSTDVPDDEEYLTE